MNDSSDPLTITDTDDAIVLVGEIDASTVGALTERLEHTEGDVLVDLGGVDFIDSSGLRSLIRTQQAIAARDCTMQLRSPSPAVRRLFELSSVTDFFTIV